MRICTELTRRPAACFTTVFTIALDSESSCTVSPRGIGGVAAQLFDGLQHELHRALHGAADLVAQPEAHPLAGGGLAGDDHHLAGPRAQRLHEAQHGLRVHAVRVYHLAVLDARLNVFLGRLHHVERAGLAALAADVHEDQSVVAAHHLVGQVEPAGAEVEHRRLGRQLALAEPLCHLSAEAVVAHPRVADPGYEHVLHEITSTSGGKKNRKRFVSRSRSWPGSPSTVTPRCTLPS